MKFGTYKMTKYLNTIFEIIVQAWVLLVVFIIVYGIGMDTSDWDYMGKVEVIK